MKTLEQEKEAYEDFIRYCGVTPCHNFFRATKSLRPQRRDLFWMLEPRFYYAFSPEYLLVFTYDELILKNLKGKFMPENYDAGLIRATREEVEGFAVENIDDSNEYCISFCYQQKNYYFYASADSPIYSGTNFRLLLDNDFYGWIKS